MKPRLLISVFFLLALGLLLSGYYLVNLHECPISLFCHSLEIKGYALTYGGAALAIVALFLFLVPNVYKAWKKFAIWATPIVILIFATYSGSGGFDMVSPDPETLFKWISVIYVIVSLLIIGSVALKNRTRG